MFAAETAGEQHGVELVAVHVGVEPKRARRENVHLPRRKILHLAHVAARRIRREEDVLAETQREVGIGFVEGDDVGHRLHLVPFAQSRR